MREAVGLAQRGELQQALEISGEVVHDHPSFVPALKLRGMLFEETGQQAAAADSYRAALKGAPNDPEMLVKVGTIELVEHHTEFALALLARGVRLRPNDADAKYYLAQAYHLHGDNDRALSAIASAAHTDPKNAAILQKYGELLCSSGQSDAATVQLNHAQQLDPSLPRIHFDLAVAGFQSMNLSAAEQEAERQAALEPEDIENLSLLASVQIKLADWAGARENLQRVPRARSNDASALLSLGQCELELKSYEPAIQMLQQSLQLDPTLVLAHFFLARAYRALGRDAAADHEAMLHRQMLQYSYFESPATNANRSEAAEVRTLINAGKEEDALKVLKREGSGPHTTEGTLWVTLGAAYLQADKTFEGERSFRRALQLDAHTRDAHAYLGQIAMRRGDLEQAETEFQAELLIDANQAFALGEIGEIRYRQGRWAEAAEFIARSKSANPSLLYMLCDAYFRLGNSAKAELTAEAAAAYSKDNPEVRQALGRLLKQEGKDALAERLFPQS